MKRFHNSCIDEDCVYVRKGLRDFGDLGWEIGEVGDV